jgi:integrase/recombinase XerD
MLTKHRVKDGVLTLRTAKTGTDVRVPLPPTALDALKTIPADNYYFWSGRGTAKSCVSVYQRSFKRLYEIAKVENGHAHRWSFAVELQLLLARVPIDQVSVLLGHQSIKVTERHYSPWVKSRQEQLV